MTLSVILGTAFWLGLLTSISPCPLATNLAATAYLTRRVDSRKRAIFGAFVYTLGRVAAYVVIALLLDFGIASAPGISQGLQKWMPPLIGPFLVLTSMVLLGLIPLPFAHFITSQAGAEKWASRGLVGELVLGFLFALSFCPVSAALFFGSLIPLALSDGRILFPVMIYGVGTAAPVAGFALVMILSARLASVFVGGVMKIQPHLLKATGVILLIAGLYLIVRDTLRIPM